MVAREKVMATLATGGTLQSVAQVSPLRLRRGTPLTAGPPLRRILIRGTNWIGDAIMTLPAVAAIRNAFPEAFLAILAKPWVAEIYRLQPQLNEVISFESPGKHAGLRGKVLLARRLHHESFDAAILLQNAIEAAIIAYLAGIPIRAGYDTDGRTPLLTHPVHRSEAIRTVHQVHYYREMVRALGCTPPPGPLPAPLLRLGPDMADFGTELLKRLGIAPDAMLVGIAPGATYGPAKRWFPARFAAVVDRLTASFPAQILLFGSAGDADSTAAVAAACRRRPIDLAGRTDLRAAIALIARCALFLANDSGLMHVAGALGVPTVAVFGSTDPVTTGPLGERSVVVRRDIACSPCLRKSCRRGYTCLELIDVEQVWRRAARLLQEAESQRG